MCQTPVVTKKHTGCLLNMLSLQDSCTLLFEENKKGGGRDNFNAAWKGQHWSSHCSDSSRIVYTKLVHNFAQRLSLYTVQNNNGVSFNCWSTTHCTSKCTLTHLRWSQLRSPQKWRQLSDTEKTHNAVNMNGTSSSPEPSYWTNFHLQRACYKTSQLGERHPYASIPFTQGITTEKSPLKTTCCSIPERLMPIA